MVGTIGLAVAASVPIAAPTDGAVPDRPVTVAAATLQGEVCLPGTRAGDLDRLFDTEPGGIVGADYQRPIPLPDGRVLWLFQDAAVRAVGDEINLVHNTVLLQDGSCFDVLYGGDRFAPRPFLFADRTVPFQRWFWPLDAELGSDGLLYVFAAEVVERGADYLTQAEPLGTHVTVIDTTTATMQIVDEVRPGDESASMYGWSITSDDDWTYLYAQCYRQFGYDLYIFTNAFDRSCSTIVTVARVPRGEPLTRPEYWDGGRWQPDPDRAVPVVETSGRRVNANQIEWNGSSFFSVNYEGDWWGDTIYFARAESATGPFVVFDTMSAPVKCAECNSFFASWVPRAAADRSPSTFIVSISHNRWDGAISAFYRPSFHEVSAPPFLGPGKTLDITIPDGTDLAAAVLNITAINPDAPGYITAHRCDQPPPTTSNLNYFPGDITANLVIAHPDPTGHICLTTLATTNLIVDLAGTFPTTSTYQPLDNPTRITDTRNGTGTPAQPLPAGQTLDITIPDGTDLAAAVLNITAINPDAPGYITAHRCDQPPPTTSNLNYFPGDITANLVIAHPDPTGHICLTTLATTNLIVDLAGTFPTTSTYQPLDNPTRITDTRNGTGTTSPI